MFIGLSPSQFVTYFLDNNTNAVVKKEKQAGRSTHQEVFHKKKLALKFVSVPPLWSKF